MPTIQIEAEQLLNAARQMPRTEFDNFVEKLLQLRHQAKATRLSEHESELLRTINQGAPEQLQQRYDALLKKRRKNMLTRTEHRELLALTQQMEQCDVERLRLLAELAKLRGLSLPELMRQLGLEPPEPDYD